jgi:hypothetical protein
MSNMQQEEVGQMTRAKIVMRLEHDESGYPPVDFEGLWVLLIDETTAIIDNIPFFSREVALADVVRVVKIDDELRYVSTLKRSGNSLIRVVYYPPTDPVQLRQRIEEYGCETEHDAAHTLIAVSVPPAGDLRRLQGFLASAEERNELGYEEPILMLNAAEHSE